MKPIICYHGINSGYQYYPIEEVVDRVLIPFNLVWDNVVKRPFIEQLLSLGKQIMIDSGAASFFLNNEKVSPKTRYPPVYLETLISWLISFKNYSFDHVFALDYCFEPQCLQTTTKLRENFRSQRRSITLAKSKGLTLYPVVQGWNERSYRLSAQEVKKVLEEFDSPYFGIGSVCRGSPRRVTKVLEWLLKEGLALERAHAFGQTQRTIKILRRFGVRSTDTSNAVGNAGKRVFCDHNGDYWYGANSPCQTKHHLEKHLGPGGLTLKQFYHKLFRLNYYSIEYACHGIPDDYRHPIHQTSLKPYLEEAQVKGGVG